MPLPGSVRFELASLAAFAGTSQVFPKRTRAHSPIHDHSVSSDTRCPQSPWSLYWSASALPLGHESYVL
jgi:hypothetical protein